MNAVTAKKTALLYDTTLRDGMQGGKYILLPRGQA